MWQGNLFKEHLRFSVWTSSSNLNFLSKMPITVLHCFSHTGGNVEGLVGGLQEFASLWMEADDEPEKVPHPVLLRQAGKETLLFVEGTQCLPLEGDEIDQLLAWGGEQASLCSVKNLATQL